jgi:hypothetical protein
MAGYHAVIGVAEGGLTAGVLIFLGHVRPDLIKRTPDLKMNAGDWVLALGFVALPVLILVLAGSSSLPDPLQSLLSSARPARESNHDGGSPVSRSLSGVPQDGCILVACSSFAYALARLVQGRSKS